MSSLSLSAIIAGCTTLPQFDYERTDVTPRHVIDAVECELAAIDRDYFWSSPSKTLDPAQPKNSWVAVAELTLQVDEQMTLTPAGTQSSTVLASATRMFDWGAKLDTTSQRVYNETIVFDIKPKPPIPAGPKMGSAHPPATEPKALACSNDGLKRTLTAGLGLEEVARLSADSAKGGGRVGDSSGIAKSKAAYGTSVQFVITANVNGIGPTWTMSHFKGPGKMFLAQRMDTHKIVISFAEVTKGSKPTEVVIVGDTRPKTRNNEAIKRMTTRLETLRKAMPETGPNPTIAEQDRATRAKREALDELEKEIDRARADTQSVQSQTVTVRSGSEARDEAINRALNNNNSIKLQGLGSTINGRLP